MTSLSDLDVRLAALEADRADYRAVLASVSALGERVDALTSRVDGLTGRVDGLGQRVERLGAGLEKLQARVEGLDGGFDRIEARLADVVAATVTQRDDTSRLGERLARSETEYRGRFDTIDDRLSALSGSIDERLRAVDDGQSELKELMRQGLRGGKQKKTKRSQKADSWGKPATHVVETSLSASAEPAG